MRAARPVAVYGWGRARDSTPGSVLCRHLSLCPVGRGRSWPAGCYPASPSRLRCEQTWWYKRLAAPTSEPAPHTLPSISQRSRLAAGIATGAGGLLHHHFNPYLCGRCRHRRECFLLPSCVTHRLRHACPHLRFRGVAFHRGCDGRKAGTFLWQRRLPATAHHEHVMLQYSTPLIIGVGLSGHGSHSGPSSNACAPSVGAAGTWALSSGSRVKSSA